MSLSLSGGLGMCVRDIFKIGGWIETPKSPNKTRETTGGENPVIESHNLVLPDSDPGDPNRWKSWRQI